MNRLKLLREEKQLSQAEIGKILYVSSQTIGHYENEKRDMPTSTLIKLTDFFNVSIDYFLGKSNERNPYKSNNFINLDDLSKEEVDDLKNQIEYIRWKKKNNSKTAVS